MTDTTTAQSAPASPSPAVPMIDAIVERYIQIRDKKALLKKKFDDDKATLDAALAKCEAYFLQQMRAQGLTSLPTAAGVPYQSEQTSVTVADKVAFFSWLQETGNWEALDIKANKTFITTFKEEHDDIPPGLNWRAEVVVNVRRK